MNILCKLEYSPASETFIPLLYVGGAPNWTPEHNIWGEQVRFLYPKHAGLHCIYVNRNGLPK